MRFKINFLVFFIFTFFFGFILPQSSLASAYTLSGNVSDSTGADIAGATISITDSVTGAAAGTTTSDNTNGNYSLTVVEGTYDVQVTPPAGSSYSSVIARSQLITADKFLNFILTPAGTVTLSSHIYDPFGNPLANQQV